jgi:hypothetical protein
VGGEVALGAMMEVNEFAKALTDEACCLRGQIITGYSMVEYLLADILMRLDLKFPYLIEERIKAAKKIVDRPEYAAYRDDFHRVCDELLRYDDLRNFMAHGYLSLDIDRDQTSHKFTMRLYERAEPGKYRCLRRDFPVEDFRKVAGEMVKYTHEAYAVFDKFYTEQALETFVHPKT